MQVTFTRTFDSSYPIICIPVSKDNALHGGVLNKETVTLLDNSIQQHFFNADVGSHLTVHTLSSTYILFGIGDVSHLDIGTVLNIGGHLAAALRSFRHTKATIIMDGITNESIDSATSAAYLSLGYFLRQYTFTSYKSRVKDTEKYHVNSLNLCCTQEEKASAIWSMLEHTYHGTILTRDLMCEPPNVLYPESMAQQLKSLESLGLEIEILDDERMRELGMNALLGVGQGSARPPRLVIMKWNGDKPGKAPLALVGKGITFDTGGISIKPSSKMEEMKFDMGGAATVCGIMRTLAGRKAKANVVGVVALAENMPDGKAQRPGDIVKTMSGQYIEIHNTDAEGRLALADALWYTQDKFSPAHMIDFATLTMAMVIALGTKFVGAFSNTPDLVDKLAHVGKDMNERVWPMPLDPMYDKDINTLYGDMKNIGDNGAGSTTAAQLLQRFVNDTPWVHLDIAGAAWSNELHPLSGKYPPGWGVRLIDAFVRKYYEDS